MTKHLQESISRIAQPNTRESMRQCFMANGILAGDVLLAHSSLSALGWVSGGTVAVIQALMDAITPEGTLVMPTHSGDLTDPALWQNPPVPEDWWQVIRDTMPAFDPKFTPSSGMGQIPEVFRTMPGATRSSHPALSFAAWGRHARDITTGHQLDLALGETSPLARIYDLDGKVLLLGVGFGNNTSFHLAEVRAGDYKTMSQGSPVMVDGRRRWVEYQDVDYDAGDFTEIGNRFCQANSVVPFRLGVADCLLFSQQMCVDFAVEWIRNKRSPTATANPLL